MKPKRTSKKMEYLNELRFDNDYYQEVISSPDNFYWHHGERHHKSHAKRLLADNVEELDKIFADKDYKPWK